MTRMRIIRAGRDIFGLAGTGGGGAGFAAMGRYDFDRRDRGGFVLAMLGAYHGPAQGVRRECRPGLSEGGDCGSLLFVPNIKAAVKWVRQSEKRTLRNLDTKTRLKTLFKKAKSSTDSAVASSVEAQFDKAARKGIIHPNKAARKKARLAKAIAAQPKAGSAQAKAKA